MEVVTQQLLSHLVEEKMLPTRVIKTLLQQARDRATISMFRDGAHSDADLEEHFAQLDANGRLTMSLAFRALSLGDMTFYEMAMARLAKIPLDTARTLIHDEGDLGLQAILRSALSATRNRNPASR